VPFIRRVLKVAPGVVTSGELRLAAGRAGLSLLLAPGDAVGKWGLVMGHRSVLRLCS